MQKIPLLLLYFFSSPIWQAVWNNFNLLVEGSSSKIFIIPRSSCRHISKLNLHPQLLSWAGQMSLLKPVMPPSGKGGKKEREMTMLAADEMGLRHHRVVGSYFMLWLLWWAHGWQCTVVGFGPMPCLCTDFPKLKFRVWERGNIYGEILIQASLLIGY